MRQTARCHRREELKVPFVAEAALNQSRHPADAAERKCARRYDACAITDLAPVGAYLFRSFALKRRAALSQSPSHCVTDYLPREGLREEISYTKLLRSQRDGTWVITREKNDWSLTSF
jgi:hypothetical protein